MTRKQEYERAYDAGWAALKVTKVGAAIDAYCRWVNANPADDLRGSAAAFLDGWVDARENIGCRP